MLFVDLNLGLGFSLADLCVLECGVDCLVVDYFVAVGSCESYFPERDLVGYEVDNIELGGNIGLGGVVDFVEPDEELELDSLKG